MPGTPIDQLGQAAIREKGWLKAHKWLILRRISQITILALFLAGPWFGIWIVKGNLNSSLILDTVPLSDPFLLLQTFASGFLPATTALLGAGIVVIFYLLVSGRIYCAWVCPLNIVTDLAMWCRNRLNIKSGLAISRSTRYWLLGVTLLLPMLTGIIAWEYVNPVSITNRALVFGLGSAWLFAVMIFLLDTFVSRRAWCGHLCPVGAFYSLLGRFSPLRINAVALQRCDDCKECYAVCPEQSVITPVLVKENRATSLISNINCTRCGRCIDICSTEVFSFDLMLNDLADTVPVGQHKPDITHNHSHQKEVLP